MTSRKNDADQNSSVQKKIKYTYDERISSQKKYNGKEINQRKDITKRKTYM